jgi:hypothetical protein
VITWRRGTVRAVGRRWRGAVEVEVALDVGGAARALAHPPLVGEPEVGDVVLLNTAAADLGLGTGGYALVVALPERLPADRSGPGHLVKARYTPLQAVVQGADEQDAPTHALLAGDEPLTSPGLPVVVADLHSSLPAVLAGLLDARPDARVAYLMTDGGALPLWLSRTVAALADRLAGTVTVGQAFGGDLESVTLHSGLLAAARVLEADVAVVAQGPGNLGTGTAWGFSGVAAGEAVNATAAVGGRPVCVLRMSEADPRPRHRGVSHHSTTAYGRVALAPADVVVPSSWAHLVEPARPALARHRLVEVDDAGLLEVLADWAPLLSTMGRGLHDDAVAFVAAAAAGRAAGGGPAASSAPGPLAVRRRAARGRPRPLRRARAVSRRPGGEATRWSGDAEQVDHEHQRLAGSDDTARAAAAVTELGRDGEPPPTTDLHPGHTLVPAGDDHLRAEAEREGVAAVPGGVELLAGRPAVADVVHRAGGAVDGLRAVAHHQVLDLQAGRGVPLRDLDGGLAAGVFAHARHAVTAPDRSARRVVPAEQ